VDRIGLRKRQPGGRELPAARGIIFINTQAQASQSRGAGQRRAPGRGHASEERKTLPFLYRISIFMLIHLMQDEKKCALKSPFGGTQFHEKSICLHQVDKHIDFFPVRSPDGVTFALFCTFLHFLTPVFAARTGDTRRTLPFLYLSFTKIGRFFCGQVFQPKQRGAEDSAKPPKGAPNLEHFHQSCSDGLMVLTDSGLFGFCHRFRSLTGFSNLRRRGSLGKKQKSSLPIATSFPSML